jgi:carboxypeptidase C (cathepsin A)
MNGGPGSSSMLGLFVENGPCYVHSDSNSTYLSEYSWNNEVNMLFLDQPVQVGLSYDTLQNITNNLVTGDIEVLNDTAQAPEQNTTFLLGTYPSQDGNQTALGSVNAAKAAWHFLQTFTQEFPAYHPNDSRISIATESYVSQQKTTLSSPDLTLSSRAAATAPPSPPTSKNKTRRSRMALSSTTTARTPSYTSTPS